MFVGLPGILSGILPHEARLRNAYFQEPGLQAMTGGKLKLKRRIKSKIKKTKSKVKKKIGSRKSAAKKTKNTLSATQKAKNALALLKKHKGKALALAGLGTLGVATALSGKKKVKDESDLATEAINEANSTIANAKAQGAALLATARSAAAKVGKVAVKSASSFAKQATNELAKSATNVVKGSASNVARSITDSLGSGLNKKHKKIFHMAKIAQNSKARKKYIKIHALSKRKGGAISIANMARTLPLFPSLSTVRNTLRVFH